MLKNNCVFGDREPTHPNVEDLQYLQHVQDIQYIGILMRFAAIHAKNTIANYVAPNTQNVQNQHL